MFGICEDIVGGALLKMQETWKDRYWQWRLRSTICECIQSCDMQNAFIWTSMRKLGRSNCEVSSPARFRLQLHFLLPALHNQGNFIQKPKEIINNTV